MASDAYGTFASAPVESAAQPSSASRRAIGAAGLVLVGLAAFSSQTPRYDQLRSTTSASTARGLSRYEQQFMDSISRDEMKQFLHAYSR